MNDTYADCYALLASCFKHPDDEFVEAVEDGTLAVTVADYAERLAIDDIESPPGFDKPPREAYLRTFEAFDGEYAPPAESAYEDWWDGEQRGILSGPPASDMQQRYEALDAEVPAAYPADHISLLLEYASLLLEADNREEYAAFHAAHFDWLPAFRERVEETAGSPLYHWAVQTLDRVTDAAADDLL
jgi:TorA maturation chaperone TorD